MTLEYSTRQRAIDALSQFYACRIDGRVSQPWFMREFETHTEYGFSCGHNDVESHFPVSVELGGHPIFSYLTAEGDGYRYTQHGRSFLVAYYNILAFFQSVVKQLGTAGVLPVISGTGGSSRTFASSASGQNMGNAMASQDSSADNAYGIQAGTGTGANSGSTSALGTLIANGNAATQLSYGSMGITSPSGSAPLSYTFTRTFTNNSGANITINEAGLVFAVTYNWAANTNTDNFLVVRDVNAGGIVTINNTANSTLTYTLSYTIA